jgi:NADPH:quinone reductase-like Zn-dependent oxidoreductase
VVARLGSTVSDFKIGDAVYGVCEQARWGTHAQKVAIDAGTLSAKPKSVDHTAAASLPIAALSAYAGIVSTGQVAAGQKVLIHAGAGGVGSMAIQLAKQRGAFVATTCGPANVDFVRSLGADLAIDYTKGDFAAGLEGYDLVFDLMGGDVRYRSFKVLRPGGMISHIAVPPMTQAPPRSDVMVKAAQVGYGTPLLAEIAAMVDSGDLKPVVGTVLPFDAAVEAYRQVLSGHTRGKIVLTMKAGG